MLRVFCFWRVEEKGVRSGRTAVGNGLYDVPPGPHEGLCCQA